MPEPKSEVKNTYTGKYTNAIDAQVSKGHVLKVSHLPSGDTVSMAAFVDSWNDSFTSNWNREQVYGRMDPIQNFQSTQRTISVGFKLVAASKGEAKKNLNSVSQLIQFLYPSYNSMGDGVMNGFSISGAPILTVRYMNLITDADGGSLVGTMDGIDHSFEFDAGFFEGANQVYPKVINLSFTFHPLHKGTQGYINGKSTNEGFPYTNSGYTYNDPQSFDVAADGGIAIDSDGDGVGDTSAAPDALPQSLVEANQAPILNSTNPDGSVSYSTYSTD